MNTAVALALAVMLVVTSLVQIVPSLRWTKQARFLLIALVLCALALTMTASTELITNPGPFQIWGLVPTTESL